MVKIIFRADDLGFSEAVNYGIRKSIKDGLITSVGMIPNMDCAKEGYEIIKEFNPCLGMHTNICVGKAISNPSLISSLVKENGEFYSSKEIASRKEDTINIKECEIEIEAQLSRFKEITGRYPDYFEGHAVFSKNFFSALENVAKRHGLFFCNPGISTEWEEENKIYSCGFMKLDENNLYDPKAYFKEQVESKFHKECLIVIFHPGYLDQYILEKSSYTHIRPMECEFLCGDWLKEWIKNNNVKVVSFNTYKS